MWAHHLLQAVGIGDFNDDKNQDLVAAVYGSFFVTILFAKGDGTFAPAKR